MTSRLRCITPRAVPAARCLRWRRCCAFTCLQQWFGLSEPAMEKAFFDILAETQVCPAHEFFRMLEESTLLRFCHRLEKQKPAKAILATVNELLSSQGLMFTESSAVNAVLIAAPSSTKTRKTLPILWPMSPKATCCCTVRKSLSLPTRDTRVPTSALMPVRLCNGRWPCVLASAKSSTRQRAHQRTYGQDPEQGTKAPIRLGRRPEKT